MPVAQHVRTVRLLDDQKIHRQQSPAKQHQRNEDQYHRPTKCFRLFLRLLCRGSRRLSILRRRLLLIILLLRKRHMLLRRRCLLRLISLRRLLWLLRLTRVMHRRAFRRRRHSGSIRKFGSAIGAKPVVAKIWCFTIWTKHSFYFF